MKNLFEHIDWNEAWNTSLSQTSWTELSKDCWEKRAKEFNSFVTKNNFSDEYTDIMLKKIELDPGCTVLDIGCGPGTLTIPIAKRVKSVTALDISSEMLRFVEQNAAHAGLDNISCVNASLEDLIKGINLEPHDVVIASRCIVRMCNKDTLNKLNTLAKRAVYLTYPLVHISSDREALEAIGCEKRNLFPPYIYVLNILYQMGVYTNIDFVYYDGDYTYKTKDSIIHDLENRLSPLTQEEKRRLQEYINKNYLYKEGSWQLNHRSIVSWLLFSWPRY